MINLQRFKVISRNFCQLKENVVKEPLKSQIKRLEYNDKLFSQAMLSVKSKKARLTSGLISLEGKRLIQDALHAGIKPEMIFYTLKSDLDKLTGLDWNIQLYKLPYRDMQLWSNLTTCPGLIAFCKKPNMVEISDNCIPVTVVCDQVREPGNMGAIIRSAAGAGVRKVVLIKGCVDLWDSKVLRGASGAHFHLPIESDVTWVQFCDYINPQANFLLAVHQPTSINSIPCYPYYDIDYKKFVETIVIIGGETEGLSNSVLLKAKQLNGKAVNIPLTNNVDSLNCVSAMSIILFEIKKQLS